MTQSLSGEIQYRCDDGRRTMQVATHREGTTVGVDRQRLKMSTRRGLPAKPAPDALRPAFHPAFASKCASGPTWSRP